MVAATFNCFTIPFKVAFTPIEMDDLSFTIINGIIDFTFFLDMILAFRTVNVDSKGGLITNPKTIAKIYLKGQFWIDLVATLPLDQILELIFSDQNPYYELFGIMKLGRVLRLNKLIQFMNVDEDIKASLNLSKMIFFLIIYIHFYACIWWLVCKDASEKWIP